MECPLFHTTAILNDVNVLTALIDNGAQSYASITQRLAEQLALPLLETSRTVAGIFDGPTAKINHVTYFTMDVGGHKESRVFAYVVPGQTEELILGRPWLRGNQVTLVEGKAKLRFEAYGTEVWSDEFSQRQGTPARPPVQVMGSVYGALAVRAQKTKDANLQCFAASLADIEKALKVKSKLTRAEVEEKLPLHYRKYLDVFDPDKATQLPPHRPGVDIEIPIEKDEKGRDKEVPWGPLYSMSRQELLVLRKELTGLLDKGFIKLSKSPAGAPVLFAKKPGGGLRFCIDYRGLNAITKKDRYPLPLIRETLAALGKAKWLTKLDVSAAFHKIRVAKGEEWKTAFRTRYGLYEWNVCPFGLTNAPATFQRYINWTLREFLDDFCSAYIDDILIFTNGSRKDHREKVGKVLQRLAESGLQLDIGKCEFETKSTKYLGYIIDVGNGVRMDPEKTAAIRNWKAPTTVKGVRSFLGFANYYRIFIRDYSTIAIPLTDLTKKGKEFQWSTEADAAFEALKAKFQEDIVLATWDPERDTRVEPDASGWAVGGVLSQWDSVQGWRPVAFYSEKHLPAECNYDIHDKELLAIIKCVSEWNSELRGLTKPFTILTDHRNLEPFTKKKKLSERQVRWSALLSQFRFKIEYRPGKEAVVPDALSRREQDVPAHDGDLRLLERERVLIPPDLFVNVSGLSLPNPFAQDSEELKLLWEEALQDDVVGTAYNETRKAVLDGERGFPKHLELKMAIGECQVTEGFLRYRERLWLPSYEPLTTRVLQKVHDSYLGGHPGRDATISLLSRHVTGHASSLGLA